MSIAELRRLDAIRLGTSGNIVSQLDDVDQAANPGMVKEWLAGQAHPQFVAINEMRAAVMASTKDLKTLLITEAMGSGGKEFTNVSSYFAKAATTAFGKVARASTVHRRVLMASAVGFIRSLRITHNQPGSAQFELHSRFDGTNLPFVYDDDVALAGNLVPVGYYTAGPVYVNSSLIGAVKELQVDYGIRVTIESADGEPYPTFIGIEQTEPTITVQTMDDFVWFDDGFEGVALESPGFEMFCRAYNNKGDRVSGLLEQHLKLTVANGMMVPVNARASNGQNVTDTFRIEAIAGSDSLDPFVWSLAAIP